MENEKWDYKIDGKPYGLSRLVVVGVLAAVFVVLTIDQLQPHPNKYLQVALGFAGLAGIFLFLLVYLLIRYFCFKFYVGKNGFYYQTNPFNGNYYRYADIRSADESLVVYRRRRARGRTYRYYFTFTLKTGERKTVIFEKALHEREINVLKDRINAK